MEIEFRGPNLRGREIPGNLITRGNRNLSASSNRGPLPVLSAGAILITAPGDRIRPMIYIVADGRSNIYKNEMKNIEWLLNIQSPSSREEAGDFCA